MPISLGVPGLPHVSNLRIAPFPETCILHIGRRQARTAYHSPHLHTHTVAYTDTSIRGSLDAAAQLIDTSFSSNPPLSISGPYLKHPDNTSMKILSIVHAVQEFVYLPKTKQSQYRVIPKPPFGRFKSAPYPRIYTLN